MKIHLKTSDEPIQSGTDITANCGAMVNKAAVRFWFDLQCEDSAHLNSMHICGSCYATRTEGMYLSGVVNGQEALTEKVDA